MKARAYCSSANLGPGFDLVAAALDAFYDEVSVVDYSEDSKPEVVITDNPEELDCIRAAEPQYLLALSQVTYDTYIGRVRAGGCVVYDSEYVRKLVRGDEVKHIGYPFFSYTERELGLRTVGNVAALGALSAVLGIVPLSALENALRDESPRELLSKNIEALRIGYKLATEAKS